MVQRKPKKKKNREDLPEAQRREAVTAIDTNARAALTDLREVLGVLRDEETGGSLRPQHTLLDLPELLDDARSAGARVVLDDGGLDLAAVPETLGRTVYRVVQEGLTNARKHAPGAAVTVKLSGRPGEQLAVTVDNPRAVGHRSSAPTSGLGLLGLHLGGVGHPIAVRDLRDLEAAVAEIAIIDHSPKLTPWRMLWAGGGHTSTGTDAATARSSSVATSWPHAPSISLPQIGRTSCRERV